MQDQELTGWFDLSEQKPWEPGVYRVLEEFDRKSSKWFSYWDGEKFGFFSTDASNAYLMRNADTSCRVKSWRGLSSDPNAKPKPKRSGNPKVTRYVVIAVGPEKTVATFKGKTAALSYAETVNFQVRLKKIRFRSPE